MQTFQIAPDCSLRAEGAALLDTSRDMPTLLCAPTATGEYLVPEGVGKLAARAFEGCKGLKRVVLPDSVTAIGENAFAECFDLEEVVLPAGLKSIAKGTFDSCHKLRQVNLPESVKKSETGRLQAANLWKYWLSRRSWAKSARMRLTAVAE